MPVLGDANSLCDLSDRNRLDPAKCDRTPQTLQQGSGRRVRKPLNRISTWQMLDKLRLCLAQTLSADVCLTHSFDVNQIFLHLCATTA